MTNDQIQEEADEVDNLLRLYFGMYNVPHPSWWSSDPVSIETNVKVGGCDVYVCWTRVFQANREPMVRSHGAYVWECEWMRTVDGRERVVSGYGDTVLTAYNAACVDAENNEDGMYFHFMPTNLTREGPP